MLKLSKLEVFSVVAEEGSFSAAADRLHLSQPAVSRHMQELEETLGIKLFKRLRRGVMLTTGGEILQEYTEKILWLVREAEGAMTNVEQLTVGQVRLAVTPGVSVYLMPGWTRSFTSQHHNLTVSLKTATTTGVIDDLMAGRVDLGFVEGELAELMRDRLESAVLQAIDLVLVVGQGHEWWDVGMIDGVQLNEHPFVNRQPDSRTRIWIDETLSRKGIEPRLVAEFDNPEAIKEAVMSGVGVTILPTYAVARERAAGLMRAIPITDVKLQRSLKLLWDSGRPFTPVTRAFLTHLSAMFPSIEPIIPASIDGIFEEE